MSLPVRALVLDRDGTLVEHVPYLADPAGVRLLPGVREGLAAAKAAGLALFLHTNQSGVGRGMYGLAAVHACNDRMLELLGLGDDLFTRICIAPEAPDKPSIYRKPSPRFAHELMDAFGYKPAELCYVGDRGADIATAQAAGTRAVGVATGLDDLASEARELGLGDYRLFSSFHAAITHVLTECR
jgi:D-glycero-D-manno-heptose 1,7-bisphosphate phosphatase